MSSETTKAEIAVRQSQIVLLNAQIKELNDHLAEEEWMPITWEDLALHLKNNPKPYRENPKVCREFDRNTEYATYCLLTNSGHLQIGPYFYNTRFPRDPQSGELTCDLYVKKNFEPWSA